MIRRSAFLFFALAACAFALDPAGPVVREEAGIPVEWLDSGLPETWALTSNYRLAAHRWEFDGWRQQTAAEIQARADARAAAQAAADAAALAPAEFDNGIVVKNGIIYLPAVPGASNGWAVAVSTAGDLLTTHWYGSPTSTVSEIEADIGAQAADKAAKRAAIRAAKERGSGLGALAARVAALEAERGVE